MMISAFGALTALLLAIPAAAQVVPGQTGPAFALSNVNDSTFALATPRTKPLVLIFTTKDLGDYSLAWRDSLSRRAGAGVEIQTILDLSDVSSWQRGIARLSIRAKGSKSLLDWDGKVARAWRGTERGEVVIIGVTPGNVARFRAVGAATAENVRRIVGEIEQMR